MDANLEFIMAMSCVLPVLAIMIRFKQLNNKFRFFILLMLLDVAMETGVKVFPDGALNFNVYLSVWFGCLLFFMYLHGFVKKGIFFLLPVSVILGLINFIYFEEICKPFVNTSTNGFFVKSCYLFYFTGLIILYLSIEILTGQITAVKNKLIDNPWFWITVGYTLSISYNFLIFSPYIFAMTLDVEKSGLLEIQRYVNVFSYILFTVAVVKMPSDYNAPTLQIQRSKMGSYG